MRNDNEKRVITAHSWVASMLLAIVAATTNIGIANGAGGDEHIPSQRWSFDGVFGKFDRSELQRGLQVYIEVCANCHSLEYVAYRNLSEIGYDETQIKAIASQYEIEDGPNSDGEMFTRKARPSDYFVKPYANDVEASVMNNGAFPPDLSLIYKARSGGADYIYALLTGYEEEAGDHEVPEELYYNPYFPGGAVSMPQPLYGDDVEYADGTIASIEQEARDISAFLSWAAEPKLNMRKKLGVKVLLFLAVLSALLFASKRKIWREIH